MLPTLLALLLLSCWAPPLAEEGDDGGPGDPEARAPEGWPEPPFTAWTTRAPASIVGPGGTLLAQVSQAGVRVEVLQVLPARVRLRCTGCSGAAAGLEGWLQVDAVHRPGGPELPLDHPLHRALELRAAWAAGADLPPGADADALCGLLDGGWTGHPPRWSAGGATLSTEHRDDGWTAPRLVGQPPPAPGACAVSSPPPG